MWYKYTRIISTYIELHFPIESIVEEEVMSHANSVRFHGVTLSIEVVAYVTYMGTRGK